MFMRITHRQLLLFLAAASLAALSGAWIAQYGFSLHPCHLCMLQRYPYMAVAAIGAVAAWRAPARWHRPTVLACAALLALDAGIAFYHAGVELHWFPGPQGCTSQGGGDSIEELRKQILGAPLVACDTAAVHILGLSMAAWNALYAGALAALALWRGAKK